MTICYDTDGLQSLLTQQLYKHDSFTRSDPETAHIHSKCACVCVFVYLETMINVIKLKLDLVESFRVLHV